MSSARIRKDDQVVVIAGKDKGSTGRVLRIFRDTDRVIVEGINRVKRHMKATQRTAAGIVEKEASVHISNVMPLDTKSDNGTRVKAGENKDGKKVRVATKSGAVLDG